MEKTKMKVIENYTKKLENLTGGRSTENSIDVYNLILRELKIDFPKEFAAKFEIKINRKRDPFLNKAQKDLVRERDDCLVRLSDIKQKKEKKADTKDAKIKELTDSLQRLQADFENYKKAVDRQKAEFVKYAHADLIERLLPILDSFELALKNKDKHEDFIKGVELIFSQLYQLLEKEGLRKIEANGKKFDAYKHEVLMTEKSDKEEDVVLEELQKGYMLGDKVVRHSKVKVSKK